MDTMDVKHQKAFCPQMIEVLHLQKWEQVITPYWMQINLYTSTRGINRFVGLQNVLLMLEKEYGVELPFTQALCDWIRTTKSLSGQALREYIQQRKDTVLQPVLDWSDAVNSAIRALPHTDRPFEGAAQTLAYAHTKTDTAVVSSANTAAVETEWSRHGILDSMDVVMGQEAGSKANCISSLLQKGYRPEHVLMVGDALGDLQAAQQNGVLFYPILVGKEAESWRELQEQALPRLLSGNFDKDYQDRLIARQRDILR